MIIHNRSFTLKLICNSSLSIPSIPRLVPRPFAPSPERTATFGRVRRARQGVAPVWPIADVLVSKDGVTTTSTEVSQDKWGTESRDQKCLGRSSLWFDPRANHDALPDCPRGRGMEKDVGCQGFCTRPSSHQYQLLGDAQLRQLAEGEDYFQYQPGTAWRGRGPKKWDELLQITLLRVIPALTYYSGILSDILSDIYSDILSAVLSGILSDMCSSPGVPHSIRS